MLTELKTDANANKNDHYSEEYFAWQSQIGRFGGIANKAKFEQFVKPTDFLVDFGAGGGFIMEQLQCQKKIGVEINASARSVAEKRGLTMVDKLDKIADNTVDLVITHHALEHTDSPLEILKEIHRILKPNGRVVCVVPCEAISYGFIENDINFHLYTWSPMCLGNLFVRAGFKVLESKPYIHKWPPYFQTIQKIFGWSLFHVICRIWARIDRKFFQVRCAAIKQA